MTLPGWNEALEDRSPKPLREKDIQIVSHQKTQGVVPAAPPTPAGITREALDIALDLATGEAAHVHEMYAGYKPHRHAAVDRDVEKIKAALAQLDELSGQIAALWEQLAHRDRIAEDLRAATAAEREDAQRYRWLRDPRVAHWQMHDKHGCMVQGKELDAAIDAAIRPIDDAIRSGGAK